jgi:hypothetical protein
LMKHPNQEKPGAAPEQAAGAKKAEKVQSSRYEWEKKTAESETRPKSKAAQSSLMGSLGAWLRKFFTSSRDFFDKDDDATPSPA